MRVYRSSNTTVNWFLVGLFILIFLVSTGFGIRDLLSEHAFLTKAELEDGTVTDYMVDSSGRSVEFCPIIDFTTKAGQAEEYEGADCQNHPQDVPIGKHVQVRYDPEEPDRFQTDQGSVFYDYLNESFGFFFGFLFLAIAMLILGINIAQILRTGHLQRNADVIAMHLTASHGHTSPPSGGESEASLLAEQARLQAAEAEVQRKLEQRRQQGQ